jgi:hypothetical protein
MGSAEYVWAQVDYLVWRLDGMDLPTLARTNPIGTPLPDAGLLTSSDDVIGGEEVGDHRRSGGRLHGGIWLDPWQEIAVIGDFFDAGNDGTDVTAGSSGSDIITRPFFNTQTDAADRRFVNIPGDLIGSLRVQTEDEFQSAGAGLQMCLLRSAGCTDDSRVLRVDVIAGYRYFHYDTQLNFIEDRFALAAGIPGISQGQRQFTREEFSTSNEFHGGELGLEARMRQERFWLDGLVKLAIGGNRRTVDIKAYSIRTTGGFLDEIVGGGAYVAEGTNAGHHTDSVGMVIPEFRLGVGYQITPRISARLGYNLIIWDDVVQAASELPPGLAVDPRNLPLPAVVAGGGSEPEFPGFQGRTLVAHGVDLGLELAY